MTDRAVVRGHAAIRKGNFATKHKPWPDWETFSEDGPEDARERAEKENAASPDWTAEHPVLRISPVEIRELPDD